MVHEISGADREPRISRGGLHEDLFEWRLIKNFPVGDAIERHAAGQANRLLLGSRVQRSKHFEQDFFESRLQASRAVTMHLFDRRRRIARRSQAFGHISRRTSRPVRESYRHRAKSSQGRCDGA